MGLAETSALKAKYLFKLCLKLCFSPFQLLRHDGGHELVGARVKAPRFKENFDLERCLDGHLVDNKGTLLPRVGGLLLVVGGPVRVYSYVMSLFTRRGAVDKPAIQTVLDNFGQFFQARRDSLKVVVTEKIFKRNVLPFLRVLISEIKVIEQI